MENFAKELHALTVNAQTPWKFARHIDSIMEAGKERLIHILDTHFFKKTFECSENDVSIRGYMDKNTPVKYQKLHSFAHLGFAGSVGDDICTLRFDTQTLNEFLYEIVVFDQFFDLYQHVSKWTNMDVLMEVLTYAKSLYAKEGKELYDTVQLNIQMANNPELDLGQTIKIKYHFYENI